ncbi:hypothetical protein [Stenotrophobium rhamnosiphilum]|uniref:MalT-like TPR region domain-containing protein n=1 Tax=Stenotrophobium rhamnosiphilum TaxID=2029166 RepID=A0A2T5MKY4_9GAMM|nr:hypothetical protein [Stenotrophobium rhamnosiphilum]PTU33219.1 hypothetical protein CJD38_03710 [Stenotrophobium rhamnosiphilum]
MLITIRKIIRLLAFLPLLALTLASCSQLTSTSQEYKDIAIKPVGPYESIYAECRSASQQNRAAFTSLQDQFTKALEICQAGLRTIVDLSGSDAQGYPIYQQLGLNEFSLRHANSAIHYLTQSIKYAQYLNDTWSAMNTFVYRSGVFRSMGQYSLAQNDLDIAAPKLLGAYNFERKNKKPENRMSLALATTSHHFLLSEYARLCLAQGNFECAISKARVAQVVYREGMNAPDPWAPSIIATAEESISRRNQQLKE